MNIDQAVMDISAGDGRGLNDAASYPYLDDQFVKDQVSRQKWYLPIDFGNGIVSRVWNWPAATVRTRHMGVAKFDFIIRPNLPDLQGKRVLDLGCNAGISSLYMARLGAREVVGIDSKATWAPWEEQANFVKKALEWRCETRYNVRFIDADMRSLGHLGLGRFDIVIALCCIYYLEDEEVARLIRAVAECADCFLIQGNTVRNDHQGANELKRRAHPRFLAHALRENGFPHVQIDWPWLYDRPVIVGRKAVPTRPARRGLRPWLGKVMNKMRFIPDFVSGIQ
jgi:SAM-dependent methyltransferase